MGKTFKRNEGRRPKWDKRGKKSHKQKDFADKKSKFRPSTPSPPYFEPEEFEE